MNSGTQCFLGTLLLSAGGQAVVWRRKEDAVRVSPAKDDVMSYCRDRSIENEEMINRFSSCNLDMIKNKVAPAIMSGGSSQIKNRSTCR